MENKESACLIPLLPPGLSMEGISKERRPTVKDWEEIQGGKPTIKMSEGRDDLCEVIHGYSKPKYPLAKDAVVITSFVTLKDWKIKTISYNIGGREVEFPIAMLWKFHGQHCLDLSGGRR